MILINMPMPARCMDCPCSYLIQSGEFEGEMMCAAMEANGCGIVIVDEMDKPEVCPIVGVVTEEYELIRVRR